MGGQVSVTREIQAPAQQVWELVADVTRMGEWSTENAGARWLPGVKGPQRGARFLGENRNGWRRWWTICTILDSEPGRLISFRVTAPVPIADWSYHIEDTPTGCRVTESWTDRRGRFIKPISTWVSGVGNRDEVNRAAMEQTLDRLKAAAEAAVDSQAGKVAG